jgi:hypothetical protein
MYVSLTCNKAANASESEHVMEQRYLNKHCAVFPPYQRIDLHAAAQRWVCLSRLCTGWSEQHRCEEGTLSLFLEQRQQLRWKPLHQALLRQALWIDKRANKDDNQKNAFEVWEAEPVYFLLCFAKAIRGLSSTPST